MSKKIDLNKTVYELVSEYPELTDIMYGLGFTEITKKAMLNSVGRITTILLWQVKRSQQSLLTLW